MKEFYTIEKNVETEIVVKKSKFIANIFYISTNKEAEEKIKEIKKKYFDARHNCFSYRVVENDNIIEKSSDEGEPSGTAGGPMLNILQKNNLANILIVVTRYFGGILLGTGGLVRAYSDALLEVLEKTQKVKMESGLELEVTLSYNNFENFKYYCKNHEINIISTNYNENIVCKIDMELEKKVEFDRDYENKRLNLMEYKELNIKYIKKSI